jgi:hypothetical protein
VTRKEGSPSWRSRLEVEDCGRERRRPLSGNMAQFFFFLFDSTVAEAMVAWKAVNFCNDLGFHEVIFEGNALTIVNAFRHSEPCWSSYSQLIEDTQIRLHSYKSYVVRHI